MTEKRLPLEDSFDKTKEGEQFKQHVVGQKCLYVVSPIRKELPYLKPNSIRGSSSAFHAIKAREKRKEKYGLALYCVDTSKISIHKPIILEDSVRLFGNIYSADLFYHIEFPKSNSSHIGLRQVETDSMLSAMLNNGYESMVKIAHMSNNGNSDEAVRRYHEETINIAIKEKLVQHRAFHALKKRR